MKRNDTSNNLEKNSGLRALLGEPTMAKSSGFAFSLATILPVFISLIFLIAVSVIVGEGAESQDWYAYINFLTPQCGFAFVLLCYLKYKNESVKGVICAQKCDKKYYFIAVVLQFGLFFLSELNGIFLEFLGKFGYQDSGIILPNMEGFGFVGVLIVVALLPAIFEECIFRGALLKGMRSFGQTGAVLLCGGLFALYHQNPAQTLYQFCCGVAFALIALRAGSVLPTILAHFINNAVIITLTKFGVVSFTPIVNIILWITSPLALAGAIVYLTVFDKNKAVADKKEETEDKKERKNFFLYASVGIAVCAFTWLAVLFKGM